MNTEVAVDSRALKTEVDSVGEGCPEGRVGTAVDALAVARVGTPQLLEEGHGLTAVEARRCHGGERKRRVTVEGRSLGGYVRLERDYVMREWNDAMCGNGEGTESERAGRE
eukprot:scaffold24022_cov28-Tisochrysis_lutea.AAC.1